MRPEYVPFAWPPTACANNIGHFVNFAKNIKHVMTGNRRVSVVRVLLRLDRHDQMSMMQKGASAVVTGVIREDIHVLETSVLSDPQRSTPIQLAMPDGQW